MESLKCVDEVKIEFSFKKKKNDNKKRNEQKAKKLGFKFQRFQSHGNHPVLYLLHVGQHSLRTVEDLILVDCR